MGGAEFFFSREMHFGDPHIGDLRRSGKIYWEENKGLPPGARCLPHDQVTQLPLTVEGVQTWGPELRPPAWHWRPQEPSTVPVPLP